MNMATQNTTGTKRGLTRTATVDKNGKRTHTFNKPEGAAFDGTLTQDSANAGLPETIAQLKLVNVDLANERKNAHALEWEIHLLETKRATILRNVHRSDIDGKSAKDLIRWMGSASKSDLNISHAELLAEHEDVRVVRVLAGSKHRSQLSTYYQEMLLDHADRTVRTNFLTENMSLTEYQLRLAATTDRSGHARMAAQNELNERFAAGRTDQIPVVPLNRSTSDLA